ncbi:MAG: type II secretion system protein [Atopobiaceae bacterium]
MSHNITLPRRRGRGFTLTEMLTALIIITVAVSLVVPAFFSLRRAMRLTELDHKAQQVYNVCQSRLRAELSSGVYQELSRQLAGQEGARVQEKPADLTYETGRSQDWSDYTLYQVQSGDKLVDSYLVTKDASSISKGLITGSFVVELSPNTGEVFSVFYWEDDGTGADGLTPTYETLRNLRTRAERSGHAIGYFAGSSIKESSPLTDNDNTDSRAFSDLELSVVNAEELYCSFKSSTFGELLANEDMKKSLRLRVFVDGAHSSNAWGGTSTWSRDFTLDGRDGSTQISLSPTDDEFDVVLDSMRENMRFANIVSGIMPGSNLSITLAVYCDIGQGGDVQTQAIKTLTADNVNSLFGTYDENTKTVEVSAVRHLRNLDLTSAAYDAFGSSYNAENYTYNFCPYQTVRLSGDIDFDGTKWLPGAVSVQSRQAQGDNLNPLASMSPIKMAKYMRDHGGEAALDGANHTLTNFRMVDGTDSKGDKSAGLLQEITYDVSDLTIKNMLINVRTSAGALSGVMRSGRVSNVHVISDDTQNYAIASTSNNVGGLLGQVTGGGSSTIADSTVTSSVSGATNVGGIIGKVGGGIKIEGVSFGYELGDAKKPRDVVVVGSQYYIGGAFGSVADGSEIAGVRVRANVSGRSYVGGIAGEAEGKLTNLSVSSEVESGQETRSSIKASLDFVGGAFGRSDAWSVSDVTVCASVEGTKYVGGISGYQTGTIERAKTLSGGARTDDAVPWVQASGNFVGGAFGYQQGQASWCSSEVHVVGVSEVGGLAGYSKGSLSLCSVHSYVNDGASIPVRVLASGDDAGGLVGRNESGDIDGCFAAAQVDNRRAAGAGNYYGGLVGYMDTGNLTNSYASGDVRAYAYVGGIAGRRVRGWWSSVFETGDVTATDERYVGALIGFDDGAGSAQNCMAYGAYVRASNGVRYGRMVGQSRNLRSFTRCSFVTYEEVFGSQPTLFEGSEPAQVSLDAATTRAAQIFSATADETYPWSSELVGYAFPYKTVAAGGTVLPYYGRW